jgi:hypothetical protein
MHYVLHQGYNIYGEAQQPTYLYRIECSICRGICKCSCTGFDVVYYVRSIMLCRLITKGSYCTIHKETDVPSFLEHISLRLETGRSW